MKIMLFRFRDMLDVNPYLTYFSQEQLKHFKGVQACIWSEPMTDRAIFDRLVFPRLSAIAETGWTRWEAKSWERFSALVGLMPIVYGHWAEAQG